MKLILAASALISTDDGVVSLLDPSAFEAEDDEDALEKGEAKGFDGADVRRDVENARRGAMGRDILCRWCVIMCRVVDGGGMMVKVNFCGRRERGT